METFDIVSNLQCVLKILETKGTMEIDVNELKAILEITIERLLENG